MRHDGNTFIFDNMRDDFPDFVALIERIHDPVKVDNRLAYEIRHVSVTLLDPLDALPLGIKLKELNVAKAALTALQLVAGTTDDSLVERVGGRVIDEHERFLVEKLKPQLQKIEQILRENKASKFGVAVAFPTYISVPGDSTQEGTGPRLLTLQFMERDGRLDLVVNLRFVDVIDHLPYDLFVYGQLLASMAQLLNLQLGVLHLHTASLVLFGADLKVLDYMQRTDVHVRPADLPNGFDNWIEQDWLSVTQRAAFVLAVVSGKIVDGINPNAFSHSEKWYLEQLRPYWKPSA